MRPNIKIKVKPDTPVKQFAIRARTICPALILATNRTVKVSGRINILTVSIKIRKGANITGDPAGAKCAADSDGFTNQPERRINAQKVKAKPLATHKLLVKP